jgi:CARDB
MSRKFLIVPLLAAALAAAASVAPAAERARPSAVVKLAACSIEDASATFVGRMRQVTGSERMWMRFKLLEKGTLGFRARKAPGLGRWRKSKPGVGAFSYRQVVRGLESGSIYRAEVQYRWHDAEGGLVQAAKRRSAACRQFDVLPNLTAAPVGGRPAAKPGVVRYRVLVTNEGIAAATSVPVRLSVDGHAVDTEIVASLAPAERRLVTIHGPACTRSVEAAADPDGVIVESSEADNARTVDCADLPSF